MMSITQERAEGQILDIMLLMERVNISFLGKTFTLTLSLSKLKPHFDKGYRRETVYNLYTYIP